MDCLGHWCIQNAGNNDVSNFDLYRNCIGKNIEEAPGGRILQNDPAQNQEEETNTTICRKFPFENGEELFKSTSLEIKDIVEGYEFGPGYGSYSSNQSDMIKSIYHKVRSCGLLRFIQS